MKKYILIFLINFLLINIIHSQETFVQEGLASFYANKFEGRTTASGEKYEHDKLTGSHLTLPFGTMVKVTNLENNKSVVVRINDRGPFIKDRIIDVSKSAAEVLDFIEAGLVNVKIEVVENAPEKTEKEEKEKSIQIETKIPEKITAIDNNKNPYYSFNIKKINPQGYGIQIGSYKEMINLARLSEEVKTKYGKDVIVQVSKVKNEKYYRIILGTFPTKNEAIEFKVNLKKEFSDCYIVTF